MKKAFMRQEGIAIMVENAKNSASLLTFIPKLYIISYVVEVISHMACYNGNVCALSSAG